MEIENMHPFCLPFGLCHDATSSTAGAVDTTAAATTTATTGSSNQDGRLSSTSPSLSPTLSRETKLANQRSKNGSPSDELLFRQLNSTISSTSTTLLNHHDLSSLNDLLGDGSFYSSLGGGTSEEDDQDDRLRKSSILSDIDAFTDCGKLEEEDEDDVDHGQEEDDPIDWYYGEYSLFSPTRKKSSSSSSLSASARAAIRATNLFHHQVFQHLVDPIDIKSSPTLAQLNLNSTADHDPMDVFWDSAAVAAPATPVSATRSLVQVGNNKTTTSTVSAQTTTTNHHHHHQFHTADLPSNCTSINKSSGSSCCSRTLLSSHHHHSTNSSNLLQQQQHNSTNQQHTQQTNSKTAHQYTAAHLLTSPACHQQQQQSSYQTPAGLQTSSATCPSHLSVAPHPSCTCQHGSNLKPTPSAPHNQQELNQQQPPMIEQDPKRPSSPALVTSSSSPLSSSAAAAGAGAGAAPTALMGQLQQQQQLAGGVPPAGENNKLKENIEYLTALLCNGGNKLEPNPNQQQQQQQAASSISSTMARSYTTLAHTLSTGPKLFEAGQRTLAAAAAASNPTNEAAPCLNDAFMKRPQHPHQQVLNHQQLQQQQPPQWVKVESSISAADSTGETAATYHDQCTMQQQQRPLGDMRVLSSLLSAGSVPPATTPLNTAAASKCPQGCIHVPTSPWPQAIQQQQQPMMQVEVQQRPSIPPNGRPITLTPIASHNNPILQQQQQQAVKVKPSPFVQPASPSASSTASSCANTSDIGSSASSSAGPALKKPRLSSTTAVKSTPAKKTAAGGGNRARPNSMSTECSSLSSHDEGFSSQMDATGGGGGGDESNQGNDSDDDDDVDDVDSDDESFYGDYTNNDLIGASISDDPENKWTLNMGRTRRNGQKRFFWQYNVQSKGPKGSRMCSSEAATENPFVLPEASDPVFSQDCQVEGVKHSGKARRGDGNDLTPNPRKLLMIGLELKKLGKIINELAPVTDLPINARTKTRKEKNKLASRACRLKKKAQHEANKIKLYGLQREHQQVVLAIYDVRKLLNQALAQKDNAVAVGSHCRQGQSASSGDNQQPDNNSSQLTATTVAIAEQCSMRVAGQTSDFVNSVLEKVVSGCIDGGLET